MTFHADLHVHSRHSRATSRDLDLEHMAWWAARKGVGVVGTGDCVHPVWLAEIKDKLVAVNPMKKDKAAAALIPAEIRNGDWIYQSFTPDGKVNDKANLATCYQCHLPFAKDDYLTNMAKLAGSFPSDAKPAAAGPNDVTIANWVFGPGAVKVTAGQAVTWVNNDDSPHQITIVGADGKQGQRSGVMLKGQKASLQFDAAGNIAYICGLHPGMKGTIEVAAK